MKTNQDVKPFHLFIAVIICIVIGVGLARVIAPHIVKPQGILEDSITIGSPKSGKTDQGTNINEPPHGENPPGDLSRNSQETACIQVITPAQNKATGEIKDFPTPCDVPEGWQPI